MSQGSWYQYHWLIVQMIMWIKGTCIKHRTLHYYRQMLGILKGICTSSKIEQCDNDELDWYKMVQLWKLKDYKWWHLLRNLHIAKSLLALSNHKLEKFPMSLNLLRINNDTTVLKSNFSLLFTIGSGFSWV